MGETTNISWTDATWNAWYGCRKVSQGCKHCFAEREMTRFGKDFHTVTRAADRTFYAPLRWKEGRKVFAASWSDFLIEEADPWRAEAWDIIRQTPHHTYLILTKRPERLEDCLPADWGAGWANVWLGVSTENQEWADRRIPLLLDVPAAVHFVSAEPLLGGIDLQTWLPPRFADLPTDVAWGVSHPVPTVGWVIVGGESGPRRRQMDMAWARWLRDQCVAAGVPFFFKQASALRPRPAALDRRRGRDADGVASVSGRADAGGDGGTVSDPAVVEPLVCAAFGALRRAVRWRRPAILTADLARALVLYHAAREAELAKLRNLVHMLGGAAPPEDASNGRTR
ncbi:MAG: phage Gp37/Gp68 family protein [Anaerolineae bacterium]|nr:phage Gp37/Gp68 family protein [Anaerolineae bacterium]